MTARRAKGMALAAGAAMALCLIAPWQPVRADAPLQAFQPSSAPMLLTRELRRPLGDGNEIVTRRTYEVTFHPVRSGFTVDGRLVDVRVDVPPVLAPIAALERQRPDINLFPMHLDEAGLLRGEAERVHAPQIAEGVRLIEKQVKSMDLTSADRTQAIAFSRQFLGSSGFTAWPADVFRPAPGERSAEREIEADGGIRGAVNIAIAAQADSRSGLLRTLTRTVTTQFEGTSLTTRETWTLRNASGTD